MYWGHSTFWNGRSRSLEPFEAEASGLVDQHQALRRLRHEPFDHGEVLRSPEGENPRAIIGYTSLLLSFVNTQRKTTWIWVTNRDYGGSCWRRRVFRTETDGGKGFGAPLLEYGMAECGVIAYSKDEARDLRIFWDSFICVNQGSGSMCLTTLYEESSL